MENYEITNQDKYYINSAMSLSESVAKDLYCKDFRNGNFCDLQSPKFLSRKFQSKNFKYILSEIMQKPEGQPRQNSSRKQLTV